MKRISIFAVSFVFAALFSVSAFAQGAAQPGAGKIGWIESAAFGDEKAGITRYVNALKALDQEMKPRAAELQAMQTKIRTISADLEKMQSNPAVPVDQKAAAAKQYEGQRLQSELEFKQKEAQAAYAWRREELLAPISGAIFQSLQEYAKTKGYSVVLDISTIGNADQPSPILVLDPSANITRDFIAYYNGRATATNAPR